MINAQYYTGDADLHNHLYFKKDPEFEKTYHFHDSIEFIFLLKGQLKAVISDKEYIVNAGDFIFADSYEGHCYTKLNENALGYVLVVSREYFNLFSSVCSNKHFKTFGNDNNKNGRIFDLLNKWFNEENKSFLLNAGYCNCLFAYLIDLYGLEEKRDDIDKNLVKKLLSYIHNHFLEEITLKNIAHEFGYSVEHCSKILKTATNANFRDYVNRLRIRKVKELIEDKSLKLNKLEIMQMCGFSSPATFYRVKKEMNI